MNEKKETLPRRDFLKLGIAGLASALGLRMMPKPEASGPSEDSPHRWAMVIDLAKCTGCNYCTKACQAHNDINPKIQWNRVLNNGQVDGEEVFLPLPCMQCEHAPCVNACPVKATYHRADGIVMMNYDRCIGCRYCEVACPYGARAFNWEAFKGENPMVPKWGNPEVERRPRGVVEKCSFCYQRIDRGLKEGLTPGVDRNATPACVNACPQKARLFGDLNDPESPVSKALAKHPSTHLRDDLGTKARVYYLPARREETG